MRSKITISKLIKRNFYFIIFLSVFSIPRLISFFTKSDYFNGDFAYYYFQTSDIVNNFIFPLLGHVVGEIGGFAQGPLFSYILVPLFLLFNGDPIGGKIFMLIVSLSIYFLASIFMHKHFGRSEGYLTAFFLGNSPYLIKWTNLAWPPFIVPLLMVFHLCFLYLFLSRKENKYLYISVFTFALMAHFEIASLGLLLPSFFTLFIYFLYKKLINRITLLKSLLMFFISFIPHLLYDLTNNFYNLRGLISVLFKNSGEERFPYILVLADRLHLFKTDLSAVFPIFDYKLLVIIFLILLIGFNIYIKDKKIKIFNKIFLFYLLLIIPLTFILITVIPVERASFWWITYLTITYIFFSVILLSYLSRKNIFAQFFVILVILISINSFTNSLNKQIQTYKEYKNLKNEIRIKTPIEYIYKDSNNIPFNIIFLTRGEKVIDYKYMFQFLNNSNYPKNLDKSYTTGGGVPVYINEKDQFRNLKSGTYYIIIPNKSIFSGYSQRILKFNNFGQVINTKQLSSGIEGFTVQKRILEPKHSNLF